MKLPSLLFLIFAYLHLYAKHASFSFIPTIARGGITEVYNSFEITVNGVKIASPDKKYKIKINPAAFDTITIKSSNVVFNSTVLIKLRPHEEYKFAFNPCSTYEIIPAKKKGGLKWARLVSFKRDTSTLFLNNDFCFIDSGEVRNKDTTKYYTIYSSGYCPYAVTSFSMCPKDINDYNHKCTPETCRRINLHLSGGELITICYDYKTRKITAKFDGYELKIARKTNRNLE